MEPQITLIITVLTEKQTVLWMEDRRTNIVLQWQASN